MSPTEPIERIPLPEVHEIPWIIEVEEDIESGTGSYS